MNRGKHHKLCCCCRSCPGCVLGANELFTRHYRCLKTSLGFMIITHTLKLGRCVTRASTRPQPRKSWNICVHLVVCLFVRLSVHLSLFALWTRLQVYVCVPFLFLYFFLFFSLSFSFIRWLFSVVLLSLPLCALKTLSSFWCMSTASEDEVEWRSKCGFAALPLDVGSLPVCNVEATWVCFGW